MNAQSSEGFFPPQLVYGIFYINMLGFTLFAATQVATQYRRITRYFNRVETQISQINSNLECMNGNLMQIGTSMHHLNNELHELNTTGNQAFEYGKSVWTAMQFKEIISSLEKLDVDWMNLFTGSWSGVKNYCTKKLTSMFMGNLFDTSMFDTNINTTIPRQPMNTTVCRPVTVSALGMPTPMPRTTAPTMTPHVPTFNMGGMGSFNQLITDLTRTLGPQLQSCLQPQGMVSPSESQQSVTNSNNSNMSPMYLTDRQLNFAANRHGVDINSESSSPANSWNESSCEEIDTSNIKLNVPCIPPPPMSTPPVTPDISTPTPVVNDTETQIINALPLNTSPVNSKSSTGSTNSQTYVTVTEGV